MKLLSTLILTAAFGSSAIAQTTITNGGFESWGNASPGVAAEPTNWYSNQSGSPIAQLGSQTCFKDSTTVHSGSYSVRVTTVSYLAIEAINGVVTTGIVDAPTTNKANGYIGSQKYQDTTDDRRMSFTGRPDSLVGWYQYTQGSSTEQGKVRAILHTGQYFDPETPTTYHADPTANKIADLTFLTPTANVGTWTRFSLPFNYVSAASPSYIMINVTSSANQTTSITGSTMILDDLAVIYNPASVSNTILNEEDARVYAYHKTVCVQFTGGNQEQSVLTIMDITGKPVFSQSIANDKFSSFPLSDVNTGVYIYQLSNGNFCKKGKIFIQ